MSGFRALLLLLAPAALIAQSGLIQGVVVDPTDSVIPDVPVIAVDEGKGIVIRETVQHPSLRKKISFPGKLSGDMGSFRPYVRDYTLRYDFESDDEDIDEDTDEDDDEDDIDEVSLDDVEGEEEAEEDDLGS